MSLGFKVKALFGLIVLSAAYAANAQVYTGRAVGITATSTINGSTATHVAADTGPLPVTGQNVSITVPSAIIPGSTSAGLIASNTAGVLKTSQSASIVNDLDFNINGVRIRANRVVANATCFCCPGFAEGTCVGGVQISGLTITDGAGTTTSVAVTGQANQVVLLPNGQGTLTINEQSSGFETISVTGLHIVATSGANTYDVRVASVATSITCGVALPTPALVTVSGRVSDASGTALAKAEVKLTDMAGNTRITLTNTFGNFSFADVEVGRAYFIQVTRRGYQFEPVALNLTDAVNLEIRALP